MKKVLIFIISLFSASVITAAEMSALVTPKGIGIYTPSSISKNWGAGDKAYIRFTAPAATTNPACQYNAGWFLRTNKDIYSTALTAISMGKQLQLTFSDLTIVGGSICEIVFIELL